MPQAAPHPCATRPCVELVSRGVQFCPAHQDQAPERAYDHARGSASSRGYGVRWRKIRAAHLRREPLCVECGKQGVVKAGGDVDHKKARRLFPHHMQGATCVGGSDHTDNLQTLCHPHHSEKTNREDGGGWRTAEQAERW